MSDLHEAVQDELETYRPALVPPFQLIRDRRRARIRHRSQAVAAVSAISVLAAVPLALTVQGGPDRLEPSAAARQSAGPEETSDQAGSTMPVPADPSAAEICRSSPGGGCVRVGEQRAQELADALGTARPLQGPVCAPAGVPTYLVFFVLREGLADPVGYRVPSICAPVERGGDGQLFDVDQKVRDLVARLYEDASSGDATTPPGPAVSTAVGALEYDEATAPTAFTNRTALRDCGVVLDIHTAWPSPATANQEADSAVRDCWRSAREARMGAEARIVAPSADSGPIFYYVRTTDTGAIEAWTSSKDRMAGPDAPVVWRHQTCTGVEPRNLVPVDCTAA